MADQNEGDEPQTVEQFRLGRGKDGKPVRIPYQAPVSDVEPRNIDAEADADRAARAQLREALSAILSVESEDPGLQALKQLAPDFLTVLGVDQPAAP